MVSECGRLAVEQFFLGPLMVTSSPKSLGTRVQTWTDARADRQPIICAHSGRGLRPQLCCLPMTLPPVNSQQQLGKRRSISRTVVLETLTFPERGRDEKGEEGDVHPTENLVPQVNVKGPSGLCDLMSGRMWRNLEVWRAGVSVLKSERPSTNYRVLYLFLDHGGYCFRVPEFLVRFASLGAIEMATLSRTRGDTHWQHNPRITHNIRHGFNDRRTHQLHSDNGHRIFRALPSGSSNNLHLLSTLGRRTRWNSCPRSLRQKFGIRDSQCRLLDRTPRRSGCLASRSDRIYILVRSLVRHVSLFYHSRPYPPDNRSFTPGS